MERLLTPQEAAEILRIRTDTLRIWRRRGVGPEVCKVGRLCRYSPSALVEYVERSTKKVTTATDIAAKVTNSETTQL
jgi:predicted site-specific integrase-resolvase